MTDKQTKYIVLLRGVMPKGKNRVPMAQLRDVLSANGFQNVQTYIQSGNVILDTPLTPEEVAEKVNRLIKENIGADLKIVVRTNEQLKRVLSGNPFTNGEDISRVFFVFFASRPSRQEAVNLMDEDYGSEKLVIDSDAAYMYIPGSAARSRLSNVALEKKLGVAATTRNYNTLRKLIELSDRNES